MAGISIPYLSQIEATRRSPVHRGTAPDRAVGFAVSIDVPHLSAYPGCSSPSRPRLTVMLSSMSITTRPNAVDARGGQRGADHEPLVGQDHDGRGEQGQRAQLGRQDGADERPRRCRAPPGRPPTSCWRRSAARSGRSGPSSRVSGMAASGKASQPTAKDTDLGRAPCPRMLGPADDAVLVEQHQDIGRAPRPGRRRTISRSRRRDRSNSAMPRVSPRARSHAAWTERAISGQVGISAAKNRPQEPLIDPGQPLDVGDGHVLVGLVHGGADQAELDHRAVGAGRSARRRCRRRC